MATSAQLTAAELQKQKDELAARQADLDAQIKAAQDEELREKNIAESKKIVEDISANVGERLSAFTVLHAADMDRIERSTDSMSKHLMQHLGALADSMKVIQDSMRTL
ncbi:hypothetical protein CBR_g22057 [Chara braunii]|uniref:Uncharacterized protein n=1 Tax=Chara braunii TaxID=69332 RepID=A0A388L1Z1_CHABU|nr:hypothetical protein CBR_g22057 [Chara braunii]|eukprot:GBG76309.1 hypothetical protein CBR_g22057 [Chara braunii]